MASIQQDDMDTMVSSIIHLANKDYPAPWTTSSI